MTDPKDARVTAIIEAALEVFFRYGFKKTSMDDLARAAGLSRQGLYLYFRTKEALFRDAVAHVLAGLRAEQREALAKEGDLVDRLLEVFAVFMRFDFKNEHGDELLATAAELVGPLVEAFDEEIRADLVRTLRAEGVPARWEAEGLSANELAEHLMTAFAGVKHKATSPRDFRARMRVALRIVCRAGAH